jgi:hypothetical protein
MNGPTRPQPLPSKQTVPMDVARGHLYFALDGDISTLAQHRAMLCEIVVRKNRITSVTISVLDRPPRCQCRNNGPADAVGPRSCIG